MSQFISGYFCKANMGVSKGDPAFLKKIIGILAKPASTIAMVGDSFEKDVEPALAAGIKPIWLTENAESSVDPSIQVIGSLRELRI